jgi:SP family facilitated glucose transporter-like MFS transporter 8
MEQDKEPSKVFPQYLAATAANLAAVIAGSALGWTSPAQPKMEAGEENEGWITLSPEETSWIGSLTPAGAVFGPIFVGLLADRIGRKWTLLFTACPALVSWIMLIFVETVVPIYVARFILGIAIGMVYAVLPMYVGEISEARIRGALGSFLQLLVVVGFLFEYCIGPYVTYQHLAIASAFVPIMFAVSFFFFPESPYYLLAKGKREEATKALQWLRGQSRVGVQAELNDIQAAVEEEMKNKSKLSDLIATKGNIRALYLSLGMVTAQQFCGINAVLFYSQTIFISSAGSIGGAEATIIIGVVMFLSSGITPLVVERLGRRPLLLASAVGMIIGLCVLGVYFYLKNNDTDVSDIGWLPLCSMVFYIIVYSFGFGSLTWAVVGELFASNVKSNGSSCSASFCWFIGFFITKFYSNITQELGSHYTFWIFAALTVCSGVFIYFLLPETKGKSLQEIQMILNK